MNVDPLKALAEAWLHEAARYERDGVLTHGHKILRRVAEELEETLDRWWLAELTLKEAASEAGVSYDTVQRKLASDEWPNAGRKHAPRIRRCDLYANRGPRTVGNGDRQAEIMEHLSA